MEKKKCLFLAVLTLILVSTSQLAVAEVPELPHVLSGEELMVENGPFGEDAELYEGTVTAIKDGEAISEPVELGEGAFEDLIVSGLEEGEEFSLRLGRTATLDEDLTVEFGPGEVEEISDTFILQVEDFEPVIQVDSTEVEIGETVEFDGSGSSGSTGVVGYNWDFGTGETDTGEVVEHGFEEEGEYEVKLEVVDEVGNTATTETNIEVTTPPGEITAPDLPDAVPEVAEADEATGAAFAEIDVNPGQVANVEIPETGETAGRSSVVESISLTSASTQTLTVNVRPLERGDTDVDTTPNQLSFEEIEVGGDVVEGVIRFTVQKDTLEQLGANPTEVNKQRYNPVEDEWEVLETSITGEVEEDYIFEAEVPEFSLFATAVGTEVEEPEPDIQVTGLEVDPSDSEPPTDVEITIEVENIGEVTGEKNLDTVVDVDGNVYEVFTDTLEVEAEETKTHVLDTTITTEGTYTVSLEDEQETFELATVEDTAEDVQVEDPGPAGFIVENPTPFGIIIASVVALIGIIIYQVRKE